MDYSDALQRITKDVMEFARRVWHVGGAPWSFDAADYESIADRAFGDLTKGKTHAKLLIRLAGQSGSGKTTQLLPAALGMFKARNIDPVHVAVRIFAPYHPFYGEIERTDKKSARENTNEFALILLFLTMIRLIRNDYPVILETNLLDPSFEEGIASLLLERGYEFDIHLLAVSKAVSDSFIEKRAIHSLCEGGRYVSDKSSDYFYNSIPAAIDYLKVKCPQTGLVIWGAFDIEPVFVGRVRDGEAMEVLKKHRENKAPSRDVEESSLLRGKKDWFIRHYPGSESPDGSF
ncbi:hypothetical protein FACS1894187_04570 [Synergistales bacterium]|nr:hypothetical protein FACS1894187_04570 [Synergistales bacterium]